MKLNFKINQKRLWIDSMTGMSMGFFSTLIIGSFIGIIGLYSKHNIFNDVKAVITVLTPFAIGVGIGLKAKQGPLQILAIAIASTIAAESLIKTELLGGAIVMDNVKVGLNLNILSTTVAKPGDVMSAWIAGALMLYFFEFCKWNSNFDFLLIPLIGIIGGIFQALWLTYLVSLVTTILEWIVYHTANKNATLAIMLAPIIGIVMGLALSLPTSSAAMAFALNLHGDAAIASLAGTAAQMLSFGMLTWWSTRSLSQTIAVGFGTSMLHMSNYVKKPILLVIPTIISGLAALIGTATFEGKLPFMSPSTTSGMGTCALYGQIFTMQENGWNNTNAWMNVIFIQLALPIVLTLPLLYFAAKKNIIKKEWLTLWNNTPLNTLKKPKR